MFERLRAGGGTLTFHNLLHFAYADVVFLGRLALHCLSASFATLSRSFSLSNRCSGGRASKRTSVGSLSTSAMSMLTPIRAPSLRDLGKGAGIGQRVGLVRGRHVGDVGDGERVLGALTRAENGGRRKWRG